VAGKGCLLPVFKIAFTLLGTSVTVLELVAFILAIACVLLSVYESHWGWPFSVASSLLYGWLFAANDLYGEAALQLMFVVLAMWGWWQWVVVPRQLARLSDAFAPDVPDKSKATRLPATYLGWSVVWALLCWGTLWPIIGLLIAKATQSDVPYLDGFATSGSVVAQIMLAKKWVENWSFWIVVNAVSVVLFSTKGLWLTAILYGLFAGLAVFGWRRWSGALAHATR
jgi:nicotinamide mononucleotide transporter